MFDDHAEIVRRAATLTGSVDELAKRIMEIEPGPPNEPLSAARRREFEGAVLRHRLATEFGQRHGWKLSKSPFSLRCLARRGHHDDDPFVDNSDTLDHCDHYRRDRRAAAIACHLYNASGESRRQELSAFAASNGLTVAFPADFPSWWFPGWTTLVLYEPI